MHVHSRKNQEKLFRKKARKINDAKGGSLNQTRLYKLFITLCIYTHTYAYPSIHRVTKKKKILSMFALIFVQNEINNKNNEEK